MSSNHLPQPLVQALADAHLALIKRSIDERCGDVRLLTPIQSATALHDAIALIRTRLDPLSWNVVESLTVAQVIATPAPAATEKPAVAAFDTTIDREIPF